MIELPEAAALAAQVADTLTGRIVTGAEANHSPHKLMGFFGDPAGYPDLLTGQRITGARGVAGQLQIEAGDLRIVLSDGANPRLHAPRHRAPRPAPAGRRPRRRLDAAGHRGDVRRDPGVPRR